MNAAIYARKSTEQKGVADDAKSVALQEENARRFAADRGWTVLDEHIYIDDGISGAEFERRPGLQKLLATATSGRTPFHVVVVSEQKSLGREASETSYTIKRLAKAGVELIEYRKGRSLTPRNWLDKAVSAVQAAADEAHSAATRERVHEAHLAKVRKGYAVGGRVFGYRNVDVHAGVDADGRPKRSHVRREVKSDEAAVVVRMFEMYASGLGLKAIAKHLTAEGACHPKPLQRQDGVVVVAGWSPGTVRAILSRELYRGTVVWNKTKKRDDWGQVNWTKRAESEWERVDVPELRIVPEALWTRVQERRTASEGRTLRFGDGRISGRPPKHDTKNLLAGLATCGVCGGGMVVETSARKGQRVSQYVCHRRRVNGGCTNARRMNVEVVNEAVLQAIEEHALTPEAVEQVVQLSERDDLRERQKVLRHELQDVETRIGRLVAAIEQGAAVATLLDKLRALETDKARLTREVDGLQPLPRLAPAVVADRLAEWRRLLRQSTTQGRAVLQRVLQGRVTLTPTDEGYRFEAPTRYDRLFAGIAVPRPAWVGDGDGGTVRVAREETPDHDYGQLLANVDVKGMASPTGFEPVFQP